VREEKGEKHHFKRKVIEMETILNLCASREVTHEDHVKKHDVLMVGHHGE